VTSGESNQARTSRSARLLAGLLVAGFLLSNLAVRAHALHASREAAWPVDLALAGSVIVAVACLLRSALVAPVVGLFSASSFLFGFHSYRFSSQVFEFALTMLCLVLLLRLARTQGPPVAVGGRVLFLLVGSYTLLAACSLLLLPARVLEHRLFLEGTDFGRAVLSAFPKDPLYLIASVNRLWLFVLFAGLLTTQADGRALCRQLVRGIAFAAVTAAALGLLDFAGVLSLERYNLSQLFYGARYRRLQSTFGNPSWFACFTACALPYVWLEFRETRGPVRLALAAAFPVCAASLFLSGARAGWLAALLLSGALLAVALVARHRGCPLPSPDRYTWVALAGTVAAIALLASLAASTPAAGEQGAAGPALAGRFEGLSRELQLRGLGFASPRRIAAAYALELARLRPLTGLGHDSFNMHLRAQLEIPGSGVATVVNTALLEDSRESVFDDSHNTYLQVLTGTGAVGLALWLAQGLAALWLVLRAMRRECSPEVAAVFLGLVAFHFYGLFQGMAYIPGTFFLFPMLTAYVVVLTPVVEAASRGRWRPYSVACPLALVVAAASYAVDSGYADLKRRFGVSAYLPDESAEFEGFYRPEAGPAGEFRWMSRRGIINVKRGQRFTLRFSCEHLDAAAEPVVLRLSFEGRDAGQVVFSRPGAVVERRFDFGQPGVLRLTVSRTFRPATGDRRELGVAVGAIRWE
jgi:hypothetical protein